jgi:hypothetical protein
VEYPPIVAPEGDLVFREKAKSPFDFIQRKNYTCTTDWGVGYAQKTWNPLRVEAM